MRQRHFFVELASQNLRDNRRAAIASIGLHLLFVAIAAFLFSGQRELNKDTFEAAFVTLTPTRTDTPLRPTRRNVTVSSPQVKTAVTAPKQMSNLTQLPPERTTVVRQIPELKVDPDVLNPAAVAVSPTLPSTEQPNRSSADLAGASVAEVPTLEKSAPPLIQRNPTGTTRSGLSEFLDGSLPTAGLGDGFDTDLMELVQLPKGQLGGILAGTGSEMRGHIRLIRLKHSLSDWWQDPTAIPALIKWLEDYTSIRADMNFEGGALPITDPQIMDAPLIIMTGHDKDITVGRGLAKDGPLETGFTPQERAALRKYIVERGGMLFFDDCGFNGLFAHIVADELQTIFPEYPLEIIPHDHELYNIYYNLPKPPTGGDVFWRNENNAQPTQFPYQKGITINDRLAVVYNRKDYMCAMETAEIESRTMLRLRRSTDVYRFMSNLLIYALKYGGNTDRTGYTE
ncbi:DUF4159 domain-containing protein [Candidatus Poribacteria bacterium]|nr:DUF4159 domain-containing protein [Candidatus Poribacteria bacterium]MYK17610.1 DUF4159 domain-containing protein [Candidatus Poribacteria bacterium]